MSIHSNNIYLKHILAAISDVEYSIEKLSKNRFKENKDVKDAYREEN